MVIFPISSGKLTGCDIEHGPFFLRWFTSGRTSWLRMVLDTWLGWKKEKQGLKLRQTYGEKGVTSVAEDHIKVSHWNSTIDLVGIRVLSVLYICIDSTLHYIMYIYCRLSLHVYNCIHMYETTSYMSLWSVDHLKKTSFPLSRTEASDRLVYTPHLWIYPLQIRTSALENGITQVTFVSRYHHPEV